MAEVEEGDGNIALILFLVPTSISAISLLLIYYFYNSITIRDKSKPTPPPDAIDTLSDAYDAYVNRAPSEEFYVSQASLSLS
ncbi:hypothetical protein PFISCL1PPCAC_29078 [Pristionchus fissidentatus]|uniref:Small integral membrane protein 19 n=1 Tax=Pristionchus fissidentatus TaxID=1538716 RepID=A0AAV5WUM0_9BILA|nr:hypothetical protein PFISCL1PPCAC_24744 [Pristionchus fissidentatus]GMT37781.1 hypothetical protein PFISCL1PPCAC_29078 [Pristionchus fissidentatus]